MKFNIFNKMMMAAALALCLAACEDEEDTTVSPSLDGTLDFAVPQYIAQDTVLTFTPQGLSHPDGKDILYTWKVSPVMSESDTSEVADGSFTFEFGDSLGTYSISCYAYAKGYASSSWTQATTMVKGGLNGSITGTGINASDLKITVDGIDYYYVEHNGLYWFRNNLANSSAGIPFENYEVTSDVFGRFYSYEEAMNACPEGWRLPTNADWNSLAAAIGADVPSENIGQIGNIAAKIMGNVYFNENAMWSYSKIVGEITNISGMAVIPAGFVNLGTPGSDGQYPEAIFTGYKKYAAFWTMDEVEDNPSLAYYRLLIDNQAYLATSKGVKTSFGASVRCVKEK